MSIVASGLQPMPVTALLALDDPSILLAGRGSFISVLPLQQDSDCVADIASRYRAFDGQPIHGFVRLSSTNKSSHKFAAWGGHYARAFSLVPRQSQDRTIDSGGPPPPTKWTVSFLGDALRAPSWILDVCPLPCLDEQELSHATILTAHNEVLLIESNVFASYALKGSAEPIRRDPRLLSRGQNTVLYSGHVIFDDDWLVIASGTMFGQVLIWKVCVDDRSRSSAFEKVAIASFHEHEGSVFGVNIHETVLNTGGSKTFQVASCSDDRTVRVYNVDDVQQEARRDADPERTGFSDFSTTLPSVATNVGVSSMSVHVSRIWLVKWLWCDVEQAALLSFGEDTTTQFWKVTFQGRAESVANGGSIDVDQTSQYGFHAGKNIWSAATIEFDDNGTRSFLLYTGGADGRIACHSIPGNPELPPPQTRRFLVEQTFSLKKLPDLSAGRSLSAVTNAELLFNGLEGTWSVHRVIDSKKPQYPSGRFDGTAILTRRQVTDEQFDGEMLYEETGTFAVNTGLSFTARRNYVYRYQKTSMSITAWFVKPDADDVVDYLFHRVEFAGSSDGISDTASVPTSATGYHLCVRDHYNATYKFNQNNSDLKNWVLSYHVTGPEKDYTATSQFERHGPPQSSHAKRNDALKLQASQKIDEIGAVRAYCWLDDHQCLLSTEKGNVVQITLPQYAPEPIGVSQDEKDRPVTSHLSPLLLAQDDTLCNYAYMTPLSTLGALIADNKGGLHFVPLHGDDFGNLIGYHLIWQFEFKIAFMHAHLVSNPPGFTQTDQTFVVVVQCSKDRRLFCMMFTRGQILGQTSQESYDTSVQPKTVAVDLPFFFTSATYLEELELVICGSRTGRVLLFKYDATNDSLEPQTISGELFLQLHERETITSFTNIGSSSTSSGPVQVSFLTTGRNGVVKRHIIEHAPGIGLVLRTVSEFRFSFGPNIEGSYVSPDGKRVIIWAFDGIYFVCWDLTTHQEVLRVKCGGGHRNWAFRPIARQSQLGGALIWTQACTSHIYHQPQLSHQVLLLGGHGREINAIDSIRLLDTRLQSSRQIIATGAEDTNIWMFEAVEQAQALENYRSQPAFKCVATIYKHTTGITAIKFVEEAGLMFSCGGREEVFVWRVGIDRPPGYPLPDVLCIGECPKVTKDGDLRITDLDIHLPSAGVSGVSDFIVAMVYSDSSLRIWSFITGTNKFKLLAETRYSTNCLTCIKHVTFRGESLFIAASTDGHILIYSIDTSRFTSDEPDSVATQEILPKCSTQALMRHQVHQSAIKALAAKVVSEDEIVVITGGDDNALGLTRIAHIDGVATRLTDSQPMSKAAESPFAASTTLIPQAHAAAVNTIRLLDDSDDSDDSEGGGLQNTEGMSSRAVSTETNGNSFRFVTASNDQKVKMWEGLISSSKSKHNEGVETTGINIRKTTWKSDVADAAALTSFGEWIVVAGVGVEVFNKGGNVLSGSSARLSSSQRGIA